KPSDLAQAAFLFLHEPERRSPIRRDPRDVPEHAGAGTGAPAPRSANLVGYFVRHSRLISSTSRSANDIGLRPHLLADAATNHGRPCPRGRNREHRPAFWGSS